MIYIIGNYLEMVIEGRSDSSVVTKLEMELAQKTSKVLFYVYLCVCDLGMEAMQ